MTIRPKGMAFKRTAVRHVTFWEGKIWGVRAPLHSKGEVDTRFSSPRNLIEGERVGAMIRTAWNAEPVHRAPFLSRATLIRNEVATAKIRSWANNRDQGFRILISCKGGSCRNNGIVSLAFNIHPTFHTTSVISSAMTSLFKSLIQGSKSQSPAIRPDLCEVSHSEC